jgi:hypothetical protein
MFKTPKVHPTKKTIEELISDLPFDMQEEILGKLATIQESPITSPKLSPKNKSIMASIIKKLNTILTFKKSQITPTPKPTPKPTIRLSQVNKEFRDKVSYKARLSKLPMNIDSIDEYKKMVHSVYNIMSNIKIKKIDDQPFNLTSDNIPINIKGKNIKEILLTLPSNDFDRGEGKLQDQTYEIQKHANLAGYDTLDEAKNAYTVKHPTKKDFEQRKNEWEEMWDLKHYAYYNFDYIEESIYLYKDKMLSYDLTNKEKNEQIINDFMKLNKKTITYGKYIDSMKKLPTAVKAIKERWYHP